MLRKVRVTGLGRGPCRRWAITALGIATVFAAGPATARGQRLNPPAAPSPLLQPPKPASSPPAAPVSASPTASKAATGTRPGADAIPGQEFTPAATADHTYSPLQALHDVEVGNFYYNRGDYRGALSRYQGALAHDPHDGEALYGCGRASLKLHDADGARRYFDRYVEEVPGGKHAKTVAKLLRHLDRQAGTPAADDRSSTRGTPPPPRGR